MPRPSPLPLLLLSLLAAPPAPGHAPACCRVEFVVQVPEGTPAVYLTGNDPALGPWSPTGLVLEGTGTTRTARLTRPSGQDLEYKLTLGAWDRQEVAYTGAVSWSHHLVTTRDTVVRLSVAGFQRDAKAYMADPAGAGIRGRIVYWPDVRSGFLREQRHVEVWLPPGYDSTTARYPVLYMADGQNLFDPRLTVGGVDWGVDEAITALMATGAIPPLIVVGVWNTTDRGGEYSPWHWAPMYARFLIEELMPRVNGEFRTLTGPANTYAMGSSMGGLISFYLVSRHPDVFGACGCLSTHFVFSEAVVSRYAPTVVQPGASPDTVPYIVRDIQRGERVPAGTRYWFDYGTVGLDSTYAPVQARVREWLLAQGLREGKDFVMRRYPGAAHSESSWRDRLTDPLVWLYGNRER